MEITDTLAVAVVISSPPYFERKPDAGIAPANLPVHHDLREGTGVHARVQAPGLPRTAAHGGKAARSRLAAGKPGRHVLSSRRTSHRRHRAGRHAPGAYAEDRSHRRPRRIRHG